MSRERRRMPRAQCPTCGQEHAVQGNGRMHRHACYPSLNPAAELTPAMVGEHPEALECGCTPFWAGCCHGVNAALGTATNWRQGTTAALARGATEGTWDRRTRLSNTTRGPQGHMALGPRAVPLFQRETMRQTVAALFT